MTTANTAATDTTTAAAADVAAPAVPKEPSKMERARALYVSLKADGVVIPEGSSIRKEFISKAQVAIADGGIGLTKNGAITYYNNLQNEAKGKPLYITPKKGATTAEVQGAEAQVAKTDETVAGDAAADAALVAGEAVAEGTETAADDVETKEAE